MPIETSNQPWLDPNYVVACVQGCVGLNPDGYQDCVDVLKEFVSDVVAVGEGATKEDWPDLFKSMQHARAALEKAKKGV